MAGLLCLEVRWNKMTSLLCLIIVFPNIVFLRFGVKRTVIYYQLDPEEETLENINRNMRISMHNNFFRKKTYIHIKRKKNNKNILYCAKLTDQLFFKS